MLGLEVVKVSGTEFRKCPKIWRVTTLRSFFSALTYYISVNSPQSTNRMYKGLAIGFILHVGLHVHVFSLGLVNNPNKSSTYSLWELLLSISNRMP